MYMHNEFLTSTQPLSQSQYQQTGLKVMHSLASMRATFHNCTLSIVVPVAFREKTMPQAIALACLRYIPNSHEQLMHILQRGVSARHLYYDVKQLSSQDCLLGVQASAELLIPHYYDNGLLTRLLHDVLSDESICHMQPRICLCYRASELVNTLFANKNYASIMQSLLDDSIASERVETLTGQAMRVLAKSTYINALKRYYEHRSHVQLRGLYLDIDTRDPAVIASAILTALLLRSTLYATDAYMMPLLCVNGYLDCCYDQVESALLGAFRIVALPFPELALGMPVN